MTTIILKAIKQGLLNTCPGLVEGLINKHCGKSKNTTLLHLHMRNQGPQSTIEKTLDIEIEENCKTNVCFCTTVDPSTTQ